ncbi:MAG: hypothetical protein KIC94_05945 [Clostridiales bacterium]|nr:hypothetical protein [uncultured Anaerosporobacter sp.]MBS5932400.1 hypothetical protein [Clostridiales bacterium]
MKMIKIKQYIAGILVMNIFANVALPANAFAAQNDFKWIAENGFAFSDGDIESIIPVLEVIDKIPVELLKTGSQEEIEAFCRHQGEALIMQDSNETYIYFERLNQTYNVKDNCTGYKIL